MGDILNNPALIWFLIGIILMGLELTAPGLIIFFFGVGALVTSLTTWIGVTESLSAQFWTFGITTLATLFGLRHWAKAWFVGKLNPGSDDLDDEFIGKTVVVTSDIPEGSNHGRIEIKGAEWNAFADESIAKGESVKIVKRDGINIHVARS